MTTTNDLLALSLSILARLAEVDPDDDESVAEGLQALDDWVEASGDKIAAIRAVSLRLKSEAALLKAEADKLTKRRRARERERDHVMQLAAALLEATEMQTGEAKIKRPDFSAWLQSSQSVSAPESPSDWPEDFTSVVIRTDRSAMLKALKRGEMFDGFGLITRRSVRFK